MPIFTTPDLEPVPPAPPIRPDELLDRLFEDVFAEILQPRCTG